MAAAAAVADAEKSGRAKKADALSSVGTGPAPVGWVWQVVEVARLAMLLSRGKASLGLASSAEVSRIV